MAESLGLIIAISFWIVIPLAFPLTSWALGRWYQGRLFEALRANEKAHGTILQSDRFRLKDMFKDQECLIVVSEYCQGGTLNREVRRRAEKG